MSEYPVLEVLPDLISKLTHNPITLLEAPPGAGKSTVLPLEFLKLPFLVGKKIILLEPRRLAARMVAERLAFLMGEAVGETVGYKIRYENKTSSRTRLLVVTEGILTTMIQSDNGLEEYGLIVFDEFHERSVQADLSFALCREVQECLREDLKILIMSATINTDELSLKLNKAPIIRSFGKQFPVSHVYLPAKQGTDLSVQVGKAVEKAVKSDGDVLVFLPGSGEILKAAAYLEEKFPVLVVLPLYGELSSELQQKALYPIKNKQKIILATNIAETSLTIEGISTVIDSGLSRVLVFDPRSGMSKLETVKISLDSANQRAGRAGRLAAGVCIRLWEEATTAFLATSRKPEIEVADLIPVMLELAKWGNINTPYWLTAPQEGVKNMALDALRELGALDTSLLITAHGKKMATLPLHPRLAHLLLEAEKMKLLPLATDLCAVLEERDVLYGHSSTDVGLRIEELRKWRIAKAQSRYHFSKVEKVAAQFRSIFKLKEENNSFDVYAIGKLIAIAFPERVAQRKEKNIFRLNNGRMVQLPAFDWLEKEDFLAIAQVDAGEKIGRVFLAAPLAVQDMLADAKEHVRVFWDADREMIQASSELRFGALVLRSKSVEATDKASKVNALLQMLKKSDFSYLNFDEAVLQLQARVCSVKEWRKSENWADFSRAFLLENMASWLAPYLETVKTKSDLAKLDLFTILKSSLSWEQQQALDQLAPPNQLVPSGSEIKIQYFETGQIPVLAVRLQEMFGLLDTPTVNQGKQLLLLHLLSPGYKPVQVTQDLKSFWTNTYPSVRKELRVRYSKHFWPEDPWTAEAVRGVKKKF